MFTLPLHTRHYTTTTTEPSLPASLPSQIPAYFIWLNKMSYLTYAFAALVKSELQGQVFTDELGNIVPVSVCMSLGHV